MIFPNIDAANIAFNLAKAIGDGVTVGPILLGLEQPLHIVMSSVSARGLLNISAVAAMEAALAEEIKVWQLFSKSCEDAAF